MIKEIKKLKKKYEEMVKNKFDTVSIQQVISDLYQLEGEARLKRIPKDER